ncbi:hypothetical protein BH24ACT10_BH24ACT10_09740 [soil metagenome]
MPAKSQGAEVHQVRLTELNDSGVTGKAVLVLKDGTLRVKLHARDLVPDMLHPQHIHGLAGSTNATCPPPSAAGDDGILTLGDGLPFYGPVLLPLTPFPMADNGKINYHETFSVDGDLADLSDEAIVVHGGYVDGEYVATLPVACGEID